MTVTGYDPFTSLVRLQRDMGRLFGNGRRCTNGNDAAVEYKWTPAIDIREDDNGYVLSADLPGVQRGDVDITMDRNLLTIRGKREATESRENGKLLRNERILPPAHAAGNRRPRRHFGEVRERRTRSDAAQGSERAAAAHCRGGLNPTRRAIRTDRAIGRCSGMPLTAFGESRRFTPIGVGSHGVGVNCSDPMTPDPSFWWPGAESNCRHADFQSAALPTELPGQGIPPSGGREGPVLKRRATVASSRDCARRIGPLRAQRRFPLRNIRPIREAPPNSGTPALHRASTPSIRRRHIPLDPVDRLIV